MTGIHAHIYIPWNIRWRFSCQNSAAEFQTHSGWPLVLTMALAAQQTHSASTDSNAAWNKNWRRANVKCFVRNTQICTSKIQMSKQRKAEFQHIVNDNDTHLMANFQDNPSSRQQNVSILDFIGAKDDGGGGDDWRWKMCKAPVKLSPSTNQV